MNLNTMATAPQYVDGYFDLYDKVSVMDGDFPETKIRKRKNGRVWFREISVFDRTQLQFQQAHKEITIKLAIPRWDDIDSTCVLMIAGKQHAIQNCTTVISKAGYRETEITCISPEMNFKVDDNDKD